MRELALATLLLTAPLHAQPSTDPVRALAAGTPTDTASGESILAAITRTDRYTLQSVTAYWDDDGTFTNLVNDTDRYYSSGQGIELGFRFNAPDDLAARLAPGWEAPRFGLGLSLKQHIYTAEDILDPNPPADDHPYGGYLALGLAFQRSDAHRHDHLQLDLGIIGQNSGAEALQEFVHNSYPDQEDPAGWATQLPNELTINLTYDRTWRTDKADLGGLEFDMLPAAGFDAGTVFVRARAKATVRLGMALPDDFGPASFLGHKDHTARAFGDPDRNWSLYAYTTVGADAVARNAFIDGTLFADSRSTDAEALVARLTTGIVARYKFIEFGWAQTWESKTFESQPNGQTWGSWVLNCQWQF